MEEWRVIRSFPQYSISTHGRVRNDEDDRYMTLRRNQQGIVYVGLVNDGVQFKRAVAPLVAKTFLDPPPEAFDTPINRDGDRTNNYAENLIWRPRWFAIKYHQQFDPPPRNVLSPVEDVRTEEVFDTSWVAAMRFGLMHRDLVLAVLGFKEVWPTRQRFRIVYVDIN